MINSESKGPYVYQPFGSLTHPSREKTGRLFAIGGLHHQCNITGLTRDEADSILEAIKGQPVGYVNVYEDGHGRFVGDEEWDSYQGAYAHRDEVSSYVETVKIVRFG